MYKTYVADALYENARAEGHLMTAKAAVKKARHLARQRHKVELRDPCRPHSLGADAVWLDGKLLAGFKKELFE